MARIEDFLSRFNGYHSPVQPLWVDSESKESGFNCVKGELNNRPGVATFLQSLLRAASGKNSTSPCTHNPTNTPWETNRDYEKVTRDQEWVWCYRLWS